MMHIAQMGTLGVTSSRRWSMSSSWPLVRRQNCKQESGGMSMLLYGALRQGHPVDPSRPAALYGPEEPPGSIAMCTARLRGSARAP